MHVKIDSRPIRRLGCPPLHRACDLQRPRSVAGRDVGTAMVERVNLEPTMEEIVVALRETRRGATGTQPYAVVSRPSAGNWTSGRAGRSDSPSDSAKAADAQNG